MTYQQGLWRSVALLLALAAALPAAGATIGIIVDKASQQAIVFDADSDSVIGTVPIYSATNRLASCSITPDQALGFVAAGYQAVNEIDLASSPPAFKKLIYSGFSAWRPEHTAITADGKYVVAPSGSLLSVIDTAAGTASFPFFLPADGEAVEVCTDGSVLLATSGGAPPALRRYRLTGTGGLVDTNEVLYVPARHISCAPDARTAVFVNRDIGQIASFRVSGLVPIETRWLLRAVGITGLLNTRGDRALVRSQSEQLPLASVGEYLYDSGTGSLEPVDTFPTQPAINLGPHQMALHPGRAKVYVARSGGVEVWERGPGPSPGAWRQVKTLAAVRPEAVCVGGCGVPGIREAAASPSRLWPPNHAMTAVRIDYEVAPGCPAACALTVASNQPSDGSGDGRTSADWQVLDARHVLLRAERAGGDEDRVYTVTIACSNASGQRAVRDVAVTVPHDSGR